MPSTFMRSIRGRVIAIAFVACYAPQAMAQSTSSWLRVAPIATTPVNPAMGASYVNVIFRGATVYQKSNWWTRFVERNRQAVLDVSVDATFGTSSALHDTRVSNPITLKKNDSQADFGYNGTLVSRLPTTFDRLRITVRVSKTSEDGVDKLVTFVADVSKTAPTLTVSQSALGIISVTKQVADFMFDKNLLEKKVSSFTDLASNGTAMPAGVYVCLAGDQTSDYSAYTSDGGARLAWNGAALTWNGAPLTRVSYFVVEVNYVTAIFRAPIDALSVPKAWSALYGLARREVDRIVAPTDADKTVADIRAHISDAQTLLDADPDYIQDERSKIHEAVRVDIQDRINARLRQFTVAPAPTATTPTPASPLTANTPTVPAIVLAIPDNSNDRATVRIITKEQAKAVADSLAKLSHPPPF